MSRRVKESELIEANRLGPEGVAVYRIDKHTVVKLSDAPRLSEAEAMRFVRTKTSLPVPKVYDAYVDEVTGRGVILMEYIEGDALSDVWDSLELGPQQKIVVQLRAYMAELHSIKGNFIGSVDKSPCEDPIFCAEPGNFGPYNSEAAFNEGLIKAMNVAKPGSYADQLAKFVRALPRHDIVLSHADFSPRNILVRGDRVVAILDWEMAGFYPEYWDYVKAYYFPEWMSNFIAEGTVDKILKPYPVEHSVLLHVHQHVF